MLNLPSFRNWKNNSSNSSLTISYYLNNSFAFSLDMNNLLIKFNYFIKSIQLNF